MSAAQMRTLTTSIYAGKGPFIYPDRDEVYMTDSVEKNGTETVGRKNVSVFYTVARILSAVIALGFIVLLALSLATGGPIHWSVALVGCLGGIGLGGAIWLSKP